MPFLTPDSDTPLVSVILSVPEEFVVALNGAIYELSLPENWEQYGTLTPEECASIMQDVREAMEVKSYPFREILVSAWELGETSGNRADSHGGHTLTDNNTVTFRTGKQNYAASFTRANSEYLSVADHADFNFSTKSFTFSLWVILDDKTTTQRFIVKTATGNLELYLSYNLSINRFIFQISTDGTNLNFAVTANNLGIPNAAQWYNILIERDAVNGHIAIQVDNGSPNQTAFTGTLFNGSGDLMISANSMFLNGAIDQIFLFDGILTVTQKTWLYNAGNGRTYAEVIAYAE